MNISTRIIEAKLFSNSSVDIKDRVMLATLSINVDGKNCLFPAAGDIDGRLVVQRTIYSICKELGLYRDGELGELRSLGKEKTLLLHHIKVRYFSFREALVTNAIEQVCSEAHIQILKGRVEFRDN